MQLVTVTHPRFARELAHCVQSYLHFWHGAELRWLLLTESEHVRAVRDLVWPFGYAVRVEAMAPEAEAIIHPYTRQMAAKLLCWRQVDSEQLVITDDDTEAIAPWDESTFFEAERARIYYRNSLTAFWGPGQAMIFGGRPTRDFQLLLPFAIHRETLRSLAESPAGARCLEMWHRRELVSEFGVMGEWAWRHPERSTFHSILTGHNHWTLGRRPAFRDWQRFRGALRKRIAATR